MAYEYTRYEHHGKVVTVRADLKGQHREHCLCYNCKKFKPGTAEHCGIAAAVLALDVEHGLVTPVWECPAFKELVT